MITNIAPPNTSASMNLLDNANFKDAINQRGQTLYAQNLYAIDRWVAWGPNAPNLTIETGGIRIAASETTASIYQLIDGLDTSKIYTLAVMAADGLHVLSGSFASEIGVEHGLQIKMLGNYAQVVIAIKNTTLYWAALYEGAYTADTLPPYVPPAPGLELFKCQKYYWQVHFDQYETIGLGYEGLAYALVQLSSPVQMKTKYPTLTQSAPVRLGNNDRIFTNANCNGTAITLGLNYPQIVSHAGSVYAYSLAAGGVTFSLSAEL